MSVHRVSLRVCRVTTTPTTTHNQPTNQSTDVILQPSLPSALPAELFFPEEIAACLPECV